MESEQIFEFKDHWLQIAKKYDDFYAHRKCFEDALGKDLIKIAELKPDLDIVDLACGTGYTMDLLLRQGLRIKNAILVEPALEMLRTAKSLMPEVATYNLTAEEFSAQPLKYDRIISSAAAHLFDKERLQQTLGNFRSQLRDGGILVIINLADEKEELSYPLFQSVHEKSLIRFPYVDELTNCGFSNVRKVKTSYKCTLPLDHYEFLLRNKFMSTLEGCTDAEIEAGIKELNLQDPVVFDYKHFWYIARK